MTIGPSHELNVDGDELASAAELMTELLLRYWSELDSLPAGISISPAEAERLEEPLPRAGVGLEAALRRAFDDVVRRSMSRGHPRTFPYIDSSGLEIGVLAEALAAALNANVAGGSGAASVVEEVAWKWIAELIAFPATGGIFTSGGTIANTTALATARVAAFPEVRENGLDGLRLTVYASAEAHHSIDRACELLGIGRAGLRRIEVDERLRMRPEALADAIAKDRSKGFHPLAVCGTAGSTNSGAVDPLDALAEICAAERTWFHVDAAYGGPAAAAPSVRASFAGLERTDSVTVDPHKWLFVPKAAGVLLVQRAADLERAFADDVGYLEHADEGPMAGPPWPMRRGLEYTHHFRGLRIWASFLAHGADAFVEVIERNLEHARVLADAVNAAPDLELLQQPQLSIVNFRHLPRNRPDIHLDRHNRTLLDAIQRDGRVLISGATIHGAFTLRPCFTGHRTTTADALMVAEVAGELGSQLAAGPAKPEATT